MKTVIYLRTSTEDQNPENQLKECKTINKYGKFKLIQEQVSAWKDKNRPKFNEVLSLIKSGNVEHIIVWDLDRIYRNRKRLKEFFQICKAYQCKVHSYRQQWLEQLNGVPSPWDEIMTDMLIQVMGWMAEDESNKKSERVKASIRVVNGKVKSYKGNKWGRPEITKRVIEEVIKLKKEGLTLRQISDRVSYWDKSRNKHQLSKSTVHNILSNVKYKTS